MNKQSLNPKDFTQIMGAYSHGLKVDVGDSEMIFVTGQIAMDKDGNAVAPNDIIIRGVNGISISATELSEFISNWETEYAVQQLERRAA